MRYIPLTNNERQTMLDSLGIQDVKQLFRSIPDQVLINKSLRLPKAKSESELMQFFGGLSRENLINADWSSYLGAGAYEHYIPVAIDALVSRGEFLTAYTPYQPELSQGTLQAIFEFQSMMASLLQMDIVNASMYDGASALAEALMMALRIKKNKRVIAVSEALHPDYLTTVKTYLSEFSVEFKSLPVNSHGQTELSDINDTMAGAVVSQPNFFGVLENTKKLNTICQQHNALMIVSCSELLSFGMCVPPGQHGADIVSGEAQSLGVPLQFGGPLLGVLACKEEFVRQLPGRLVGETVDGQGRRGFVLTLSTREQHIRREKATSNICTNHSLCALRASIYMALMGKVGIQEVSRTNYVKAHYLANQLSKIPGVSLPHSGAFFNEFVARFPVSAQAVCKRFEQDKVLAGVPLSRWFRGVDNDLLIAVTETKSDVELQRFLDLARNVA